nr:S8 family serine peptidase [Deinococcus irradiatisoli]
MRLLRSLLPLSCALLCGTLVPTPVRAASAVPATPVSQPASPRAPLKAPLPELSPLPTAPVKAPPLVPFPAPTTKPPSVTPQSAVPSDPLYFEQWYLGAIDMEAGWAVTPGQSITVAVLDTGYVADPELGTRLFNGYDFVSDPRRSGDGDGRDPDASGVGQFRYHGEGVANIIAAAHDGRGMAGINPLARIVAVRVGGEDGMIAPQDLIDGLRWAAGLRVVGAPLNPHPARLINLSLYADFIPLNGCDAGIQRAIDEVTAKGVLIVAGAANDAADSAGYSPAGCRGVLTVAATNRAGRRASYSNFGASVALAAPGGEPADNLVFSAVEGVQRRNGTSFAAPQVTGVASLVMGLRPRLTPAQVGDLLRRTARPFAGGQCDPDPLRRCGTGLLDAGAALAAAKLEKR